MRERNQPTPGELPDRDYPLATVLPQASDKQLPADALSWLVNHLLMDLLMALAAFLILTFFLG